MSDRYRVVQWATGNIGNRALREVIRHPDLDPAFPGALEDLGSFTPGCTANRPVNAVPYVCEAAPGILATTDLPFITPVGPRPRAGALQ